MNPGEAEALLALVRQARAPGGPRRMIEIGVNEGLTARYLLAQLPGLVEYIGIDVLPGYVPACQVQRHEVPREPGRLVEDPRFILLLRPRGSLGLRPEQLGPADVVFIDGDHGRAAVTNDSALAHAIVRPGGMIIWHDYHDLGNVDVRDVLHELADAGHIIKRVTATWLAFERV